MTEDFRLPDLGEGLPEAELVQWLVSPGDRVELNQTIAEVETAKAVVELPSPFAGTVATLHAAAGDVIAVGSVLISFDVAGADADDAGPAADAAHVDEDRGVSAARVASDEHEAPADAGEDQRATPNLVGYGAAPRSTARPR